MLSNLWESTKFTAHLFFRLGGALWLVGTALFEWLSLFPFVDTWVFKWFLPRGGLVLLGHIVTPLPLWILVPLMFAPLPLFMGVIFIAFLGVFTRF